MVEFAAPLAGVGGRCAAPAGRRPRESNGSAPTGTAGCERVAAAAGIGPLLQRAQSARARGHAPRGAASWPPAMPSTRRSPDWRCGCRPTATPSFPAPIGDWTTRRSPGSSATRVSRARRGAAAFCPAGGVPRRSGQPPRLAAVAGRATGQASTAASTQELASIRPDSRLYLAGAGMIDGPELEAELRPALPRRTQRRRGTAARGHRRPSSMARTAQHIVLLRPERVARRPTWQAVAADIEIGQMADIDRYFPDRRRPRAACFSASRGKSTSSRSTRQSPLGAGLLVALGPALAVGPAEPAALRPQPGHARRPGNGRRRLGAVDGPGSGDRRPGGRLPRPAGRRRFQSVGNRHRERCRSRLLSAGPLARRPDLPVRRQRRPFRRHRTPARSRPAPDCRIEELSGRRKIEPLQPDAQRAGTGKSSSIRTTWWRRGCRSPTVAVLQPAGRLARRRGNGARRRRFGDSAPGRPPCATRRRWTCWPIRASSNRRPASGHDPRLGRHLAKGRQHPDWTRRRSTAAGSRSRLPAPAPWPAW